jgi:hypothetical protein
LLLNRFCTAGYRVDQVAAGVEEGRLEVEPAEIAAAPIAAAGIPAAATVEAAAVEFTAGVPAAV